MDMTSNLFTITDEPCRCGTAVLERLNTLFLCPSCGYYVIRQPKAVQVAKPIDQDEPVAIKARIKRPAKRIYNPDLMKYHSHVKMLLYQLPDGRFGVSDLVSQKLLASFNDNDNVVLKIVDADLNPIMSERFPDKQATTLKNRKEVTFIREIN